ncbi:MAG: XRE family transcriptional regulator [Actinomycetota bacterium]|nr:XRE family transcriptional regulator [Actinomycetota bacterium]
MASRCKSPIRRAAVLTSGPERRSERRRTVPNDPTARNSCCAQAGTRPSARRLGEGQSDVPIADEHHDEERVAEIEQELLLASRLTALREGAGLSLRNLAKRLGVSQPRVAAIERSHNVTIEVLEQYVEALGARLEVNVVKGRRKTRLLGADNGAAKSA